MKRSNDKGDQRREEAEADDDESEEAGTWQAASKEELATRKIIRVNRKSLGTGGDNTPKTNPFAPPSNTTNPFAGFSIPTPANVASVKPTETAPASSNPFAGFSFAVPAPPTNPILPVPIPPVTVPIPPVSSTNGFSIQATKPANNSLNVVETEMMKKVKKLNESFLSWAERQMKEKAVAVWKDGVKDYIKYQTNLKEKYGSVDAGSAKKEETKSNTAPPVSTNAFPASIPGPVQVSLTTGSNTEQSKPFAFSLPEQSQKDTIKPTTTFAPPPPAAAVPASIPAFSTANAAPATSSSFPSSSFSFTFKPLEPKKEVAPAPAPTTASNPFAFSFPTASTLTGTATTPASNNTAAGGFAFATTPGLNFFSTPNQFSSQTTVNKGGDDEDGGGGGGDDDEGEPILPPEKILKNENDTDEILLETPCKLFGFNLEEKEWKDSGKGSFRVTKDATTGKRRMIVRNTMGKITFNAAFYKEMKIDQVKGGIKFFAVVAQAKDETKTELKNFMIKLKDSDISHVKSFLENIVKSM